MAHKISVIIITRNRESSLKRCLDSIITQSRRPQEVVVVDNGSTDGTKDVIYSYKQTLPINYLFEFTPSMSKAWNIAIKKATGNILAIIDDDCIVEQDYLEKIEYYYNRYPDVDAVVSRIDYPDRSTLLNKVWILLGEAYIKRNFFKNKSQNQICYLDKMFTSNATIKRKTLLELSHQFDESFPVLSDKELFIRLEEKGARFFMCQMW